ncbi:MAG TPA: TonB-dependent receptor, partial [Asticcacaulis sp.]|nr:TonB-dependent receptor [Asticcacaulis sp.]
MTTLPNKLWTKHLRTTTGLVMLGMMAVPAFSYAQTADNAPGSQASAGGDTVIVVTGVRASQQSAIDRKKKAKTATDSIVAEDVGQFPDKNIGEAISRIAGVALERGNFNEGESVTLRGAGSDQTNVELDGLGLQNTSISNNLAFGGSNSGRAKDFRDLPADLIKSVDVVKGSTAAMSEGGLGGSIQIQTRTGLDFKKPYFSFSYNLSRNNLGKKLTPTANLIASRKFFNNRLGVILNYSYGQTQGDNDQITQGGSNNNQGLQAIVDFDNSPNKTWSANAGTVTGPDSTKPFITSIANFTSETPLSLVTKSAGAKTKADCYAAFPKLTTAQLALIASGSQSAANAQRSNELITCLNQWNDYTPSNIRYFVNRDTAQLTTVDLRVDFKVNNDLTVYAKITDTHRKVDNNQLTYTPGGFGINQNNNNFNTGGVTFVDTATAADPTFGGHRTANNVTGYYAYSAPWLQNNLVTDNQTVDVVPDSTLKVDANHHVISATITDGVETTDQIHNTNDFHSYYIQAGGQYRHGPWAVDFVVGDSLSQYTRYDQRVSYSFTYGPALMTNAPGSGLWSIKPATAFNQADPANYAVLKPPASVTTVYAVNPRYVGCVSTATLPCTVPTGATPGFIGNTILDINGHPTGYTVAQMPWTTNSIVLQWQPKINRQETQVAKVDVTYNFSDKMPFVTDIKAGLQLKDDAQKGWANGGQTISPQRGTLGQPGYVAPVIIPTNNLRTVIRGCDSTRYGTGGTAAPAGALACQYGFINSTDAGATSATQAAPSNVRYGQLTLTPTDFLALVNDTLQPKWYRFFDGLADRGDLFEGWAQIDAQKLYDRVAPTGATANYNFDCVIQCLGSDGKMHYQPFSSYDEVSTAGYFMVEFEQDLPFGIRFNGNAGTRYVKTNVRANGFLTLNVATCNNPGDCNASTLPANKTTFTYTQGAHLDGESQDWTPSYNYNLWFWDDKVVARYYWGKTISRPPATRLLPAGTCSLDEAAENAGTGEGCSSIGNPSLSPFQSTNQNWSLEYYPNKDTQFSYAVFKNNIKVSNPISCSQTATLFAGTDITNPATGKSIANQTFSYTTFCDGPGFIRRGQEFAVKTAFTFLPWYLKYLGFDGNYAKLHSSTTGAASQDPVSGATLAPAGEPGYYYNASLWYDDGKTNVRLAYQARDQILNCIEPCGATSGAVADWPNASGAYSNIRLPYNPGYPTFNLKTAYLDAKITHKWKGGVEGYLSVKNALSYNTSTTQDKFSALADGTP